MSFDPIKQLVQSLMGPEAGFGPTKRKKSYQTIMKHVVPAALRLQGVQTMAEAGAFGDVAKLRGAQAGAAGGIEQQKISGQYGLERQGLINKGGVDVANIRRDNQQLSPYGAPADLQSLVSEALGMRQQEELASNLAMPGYSPELINSSVPGVQDVGTAEDFLADRQRLTESRARRLKNRQRFGSDWGGLMGEHFGF